MKNKKKTRKSALCETTKKSICMYAIQSKGERESQSVIVSKNKTRIKKNEEFSSLKEEK